MLFDSDVVIDVLTRRQPFFLDSAKALDQAAHNPDMKLYIAAHAVTNIFYIVRRSLGTTETLQSIKHLLQKIEVAAVNDAIIRNALATDPKDFEDAVAIKTAESINAELIITRNLPDYRASSITVLTPTMFIAAP
ncbi:MAG: PIN domain-containing protein [Coleofasciculaceae cyanobacterium RL_1_1]|nr:PIN domain-containing protein [Coleofasciculaceae cyanobacterium RL_1_1]